MSESNCQNCSLRKQYDTKPKSLVGRIWRWHINFCPGWKSYMKSLPADEREKVRARYNLK